jgi:hypothetical protein
LKIWFATAFALVLSACASPLAMPAEAETAQLARAEALPASGEWVQIEPEAARIDGRWITPTCSDAPGADPAYRFWARRGTAPGLVLFFDGGGACWDDLTCSVPWLATGRSDDGFYKAEILPNDNPNRFGGMFALGDARNPVRDWSFIFVPYCTGDVHLGSNTAHYVDADTGEAFEIRHRGGDNFRVVLDWAQRNMAAPQQVLVAGSSAGAYGAVAHYVRVRSAFPHASAIMLGDAGQGVTTPAFTALRSERWGYTPVRALRSDADSVTRLAALYPDDRFAQFTTANDRTQSAFYALMGVDNACQAWNEKMTRDLSARRGAANFSSYVAAGDAHTILRAPGFFAETSGGERFLDWFTALLDPGAAPGNWTCEDCQPPPRCPY